TSAKLDQQQWQKEMDKVPLPKKGCFTAEYPTLEWKEVACVTPPNYPYPPKRETTSASVRGGVYGPATGGPFGGPQTVGNGLDYSAEVGGLMTSATGSFASVSGVTSETGQVGGVGGQ